MKGKRFSFVFATSLFAACTPATPTESAPQTSGNAATRSVAGGRSGDATDFPATERIDPAIGNVKSSCYEQETLFHCPTRNGKQILLCDRGQILEYSFGNPQSKSELAFSVPKDLATTTQWQGVGRWMNYSVTVQNGDTKYTVFTSLDRLTDEHEFEAGVTAAVGNNEVVRILCIDPIVHNIEGIDLKQSE